MKPTPLVIALSLSVLGMAMAEKVHQKMEGEAAYSGDGGSALKTQKIETKKVGDAEVARVTGAMPQWGYVNYWLGIPTPAGKAVVRVKVLKTDEPTAKYGLYVGKKGPLIIEVPESAKVGEFIDIDVPVEFDEEWNVIVLKKASKDDLPGPWIDTMTVLVD